MDEKITALCQSFIENRQVIEKVFKLESMYIYPIASNIVTANGIKADEQKLRECKDIIRKNTGIFSSLNGVIATPFAAILSAKADPRAAFDKVVSYHSVTKKYFRDSEYSAYLSILLSDMVSEGRLEDILSRGKEIYELMKKEHPFLTSSEDTPLSGLMAFSEKGNEQLIDDSEKCYELLKTKFSSKNSIQTVSHILALTNGSCEDKVRRMTELYDMLKEAGKKYGTYSELATLAAVSLIEEDIVKLRDTIVVIDEYLSKQKGYGFWGVDGKTRLMHAAMLTADLYDTSKHSQTAATASALAMVAAQQAAICIIIASIVVSSSVN